MNNQDSLKQSNLNYRQISKLEIRIGCLEKRVKQLEQQQTYYPFSEEELLKEPVGGTD